MILLVIKLWRVGIWNLVHYPRQMYGVKRFQSATHQELTNLNARLCINANYR
jgi:hypothetical protein